MSEQTSFTVNLAQQQDYQFKVKFDWDEAGDLLVDTGPPVGQSRGPDSERLLATAVGYCLTASLLFSMRNKFKQNPGKLRTEVTGNLTRNERGRLRVGGLAVTIRLSDQADHIAHLDRATQQFEDFCTVTESIRDGIPVRVQVVDAAGRMIHGG